MIFIAFYGMSAEEHYLNAIEALESGDRDTALKEAKAATKIDPEHVDAWQVYSDAALMTNGEPVSRSMFLNLFLH